MGQVSSAGAGNLGTLISPGVGLVDLVGQATPDTRQLHDTQGGRHRDLVFPQALSEGPRIPVGRIDTLFRVAGGTQCDNTLSNSSSQ